MASESRNSSGWPQATFVALAVLAVGLVFLWPYLGGPGTAPASSESQGRSTGRSRIDAGDEPMVRAAFEVAQASVNGQWEMIVERARAAGAAGPERLRVFGWTLFTAFDALESDEQEGAMRAFFETGRDVRFSERFSVGPGGWLSDWPTLRVAIFDYVSQRDPKLARELALPILQARPDEPGEWTLALRELVRGQAESEWSSLVRVRVQEFIHDPDWSARGSASWMEGFDVLVASGSPEALKDLSKISQESASRNARSVAFLTAERLVMAAPSACLTALNQDPSLFAGATGVRAGLFARADVRDSVQLAELVRYFERQDVGPGERAQFAASYPKLSAAPTYRLLTLPVVRSASEVKVAEAAALARLEEWMTAGSLPDWTATFTEVRRRLETRAAEAVTVAAPAP